MPSAIKNARGIPKVKSFAGEKYKIQDIFANQDSAYNKAKKMRNKGYRARVFDTGSNRKWRYAVFVK